MGLCDNKTMFVPQSGFCTIWIDLMLVGGLFDLMNYIHTDEADWLSFWGFFFFSWLSSQIFQGRILHFWKRLTLTWWIIRLDEFVRCLLMYKPAIGGLFQATSIICVFMVTIVTGFVGYWNSLPIWHWFLYIRYLSDHTPELSIEVVALWCGHYRCISKA